MLSINLFYYLVKYLRGSWLESKAWEIALGLLFAAAYYLLYQQILDHAAGRSAKDTGSLAGGHWLDVLAVVAVIQFGTAWFLWCYWLLLALPAWGAWSLYQTVMGKEGIMGSSNAMGGGSSSTTPMDEPSAPTNRKQRRAEQRNQRR